jgi:hypothetical protein
MADVELECAVYGDGTMFPVKIARGAKVSALQKAIFSKKRYALHQYTFDASALNVYLARKDGVWLKSDAILERVLKRGRRLDCRDYPYAKMISNWILGDDYLGVDFEPGRKEIHVLVELPRAPHVARAIGPAQPAKLWRVCGSIPHAQCTKEVHGLLYRLAGEYLGYCDPSNRTALWDDGNSICIHVLFKTGTVVVALFDQLSDIQSSWLTLLTVRFFFHS